MSWGKIYRSRKTLVFVCFRNLSEIYLNSQLTEMKSEVKDKCLYKCTDCEQARYVMLAEHILNKMPFFFCDNITNSTKIGNGNPYNLKRLLHGIFELKTT